MNMKVTLTAVAMFGAAIVALFGVYLWPKSCRLGGGSYGGLLARGTRVTTTVSDWNTHPGILGRNYCRVRLVPRNEEEGFTDVSFAGEGWNRFRGTYPNGTLREEGVCWVMLNCGVEPFPDLSNVKEGKYYDPSGKLRSEIKDGNGVQTYWTCGGTKVWELELEDSKRIRLSMWHDNGQLRTERQYLDDREDGAFVTYYPSGAKQREGTYSCGERCWKVGRIQSRRHHQGGNGLRSQGRKTGASGPEMMFHERRHNLCSRMNEPTAPSPTYTLQTRGAKPLVRRFSGPQGRQHQRQAGHHYGPDRSRRAAAKPRSCAASTASTNATATSPPPARSPSSARTSTTPTSR